MIETPVRPVRTASSTLSPKCAGVNGEAAVHACSELAQADRVADDRVLLMLEVEPDAERALRFDLLAEHAGDETLAVRAAVIAADDLVEADDKGLEDASVGVVEAERHAAFVSLP